MKPITRNISLRVEADHHQTHICPNFPRQEIYLIVAMSIVFDTSSFSLTHCQDDCSSRIDVFMHCEGEASGRYVICEHGWLD